MTSSNDSTYGIGDSLRDIVHDLSNDVDRLQPLMTDLEDGIRSFFSSSQSADGPAPERKESKSEKRARERTEKIAKKQKIKAEKEKAKAEKRQMKAKRREVRKQIFAEWAASRPAYTTPPRPITPIKLITPPRTSTPEAYHHIIPDHSMNRDFGCGFPSTSDYILAGPAVMPGTNLPIDWAMPNRPPFFFPPP